MGVGGPGKEGIKNHGKMVFIFVVHENYVSVKSDFGSLKDPA